MHTTASELAHNVPKYVVFCMSASYMVLTSLLMSSNVPADVVKQLVPILERNLTALLPDAITASVSQAVVKQISQQLTPKIVNEIVTNVEGNIRDAVVKQLNEGMPKGLGKISPAWCTFSSSVNVIYRTFSST